MFFQLILGKKRSLFILRTVKTHISVSKIVRFGVGPRQQISEVCEMAFLRRITAHWASKPPPRRRRGGNFDAKCAVFPHENAISQASLIFVGVVQVQIRQFLTQKYVF